MRLLAKTIDQRLEEILGDNNFTLTPTSIMQFDETIHAGYEIKYKGKKLVVESYLIDKKNFHHKAILRYFAKP